MYIHILITSGYNSVYLHQVLHTYTACYRLWTLFSL